MKHFSTGASVRRVSVVTLGCSKNTVDSEVLMGMLSRNHLELVDEPDGADAVIINTCGFIDLAREESVNTILRAAAMKRDGRIGQLFVAGCLSQRYEDELREELPEVDAFFGVTDFSRILKTINPNLRHDLLGDRFVPPGSRSAYLKISEGCDRPCSFCAIPLMRGRHMSRPADDILIEANGLALAGVRELVLVAQDLTYYGLDRDGRRTLAELIEKLAHVRGIEWIRLMYAYPSSFPLDILPVIASHPTICNYLDIPVQHASDTVLKSMRRGITRRATEELIERIRTEVPGITLRTTIITGYPAEGDREFEELLSFVRAMEFDRLGVFAYSQEDQTPAHELGDPVPEEVKRDRVETVMAVQREISARKSEALVGSRMRVFVEGVAGGEYICRSERDAPEVDGEVYVTSDVTLQHGDFVEIEVTDAMEYDLFGTAIAGTISAAAGSAASGHLLPILS